MGFFRFLLAISVISIHADYNLGLSRFGEQLTVNIFFIISGFYMALILSEKYIGVGSYRLFITNRFLRIYPIYWVVLLATIIFTFVSQSIPISGKPLSITNILRALSDLTLLFQWDYFSFNAVVANTPLVIPAWTLIVELTFYIFAVFFVKLKIKYIVVIALGSFLIRYGIAYYQMIHHIYPKTGFFPACIVFFLLGIIAYRLYKKVKHRPINEKLYFSFFLIMASLTLFYYLLDTGNDARVSLQKA